MRLFGRRSKGTSDAAALAFGRLCAQRLMFASNKEWGVAVYLCYCRLVSSIIYFLYSTRPQKVHGSPPVVLSAGALFSDCVSSVCSM